MIDKLTYRLDQFEGPLDLLLMLIEKNKVSITDIPIAMICDQYMEYLQEAEEMDLEIASEFIVMASKLMLIKSQMLLPHEEGTENDPRKEIQDALLLHMRAKAAAKELRPMYDEYSGRFVKGTDDVPPEKGLPLDLDPSLLTRALSSVLRRIKVAEAMKKPTDLVNPLIKRKIVSVEEKIVEMCAMLEEQGEASLYFLLKDSESRAELVARFMGILELIKLRRVLITSITVVEDVVEYNETGLEMMFMLNPDYVDNGGESEFDISPSENNENEEEAEQ